MKNFFKENWFKVGVLIVGMLFALSFAYSQYINTVKHNIDVANEMRQCIKDFEGELASSCVEVVRANYLLDSFLYPEFKDDESDKETPAENSRSTKPSSSNEGDTDSVEGEFQKIDKALQSL